MRTLLAFVLLVSTASSQDKPEPAELTGARKAHEAEVAKAKAAYDDAVKELNRKYAAKLKELQDERTKKGDLDGALAVRKEGERVGKGGGLPQGRWSAIYSAETKRSYVINGNSVVWVETGTRGIVSIDDGCFKVAYQDQHSEKWTPCTDGRLCIEHYKPNVQGAHEVGIMAKFP